MYINYVSPNFRIMNYDTTFATRGHMYKYATETYPRVLDAEFQTAVNQCQLKAGDTVLNIPAACVPLESYLPSGIDYIRYETNKPFADMTGISHCSFWDIPLPAHSVDVIVSLASLHHTTDEERAAFYDEARRILKPNGRLVIGDVMRDSAQDTWLNVFVNMYNSSGHLGKFWSTSDIQLLTDHGFNTTMTAQSYTWDFDSESVMIDFCRNLFGLDMASDAQIVSGIRQHLTFRAEQVNIPWQLVYFISTVSHTGAPTS